MDVIVMYDDCDEWIGYVMKCPLCNIMWMMDCDADLNYCPHCGAELKYHEPV